MKRSLAVCCVAVGWVVSASAMTPGGVRKKFVALNFDTFFNAPSNVCAHAEKLNAVPWLDGVTVALRDVPVMTAGGTNVMSESCHLMRRGHRWTRECVKDQIPYLSGIVKYPRLKESFLLAWITPCGKENRIAWTDDAEWKLFGENLAVLAWLAKTSGLKGLMLDPEEYASALQYVYTDAEKGLSFTDCAKLARRRGREVFSRVFAEFPDGVYFFLWTLEHYVRYFADRGATDPQGVSDAAGELLPYFYNGMLDALPPTARFVDGAEHYSLTATKDMYWKGALNQLVGAHAFVAPENWAKYRAQLLVGNTHYLDMFSQQANPRSHWYHGPVNGSRLEHLRLNLVQSVQVADEYVWIYGEGGRLIDWDCAVTKSQTTQRKLWEDQIPGLTETLAFVKDPDALLEMRKAEYAARGELKNLVAGCAGLPAKFTFAGERKTYTSSVMRSVKGVYAKEIYEIGQEVRFNMAEGYPSLTVSWRAKGKDVATGAAARLALESRKPRGSSWLRDYVAVPEGADEMVLTFSADLKPGENAWAGKTEVFKICAAPTVSGTAALEAADSLDLQLDEAKPAEGKAPALDKKRMAALRKRCAQSGGLVNLVAKDAEPFAEQKASRDLGVRVDPSPSVKVKPGELYGVGISCRKTAYAGSDSFRVNWRKDGRQLAWDMKCPFTMKGPRENGVWRSGSVLVRVPPDADELVLEAGATLRPGETFEFDKAEIYKLGDPLPAWPAETLHEKGYGQ